MILTALVLVAPLQVQRPELSFSDATAAAGISHTFSCSPALLGMCEMTAAVSAGDFDGDGFPDLFVLGGSGGAPDALYMNQGDGTFVEAAAGWGVDRVHAGQGIAVGDVNGDGRDDIFVTSLGDPNAPATGQHLLYLNAGGAFVEVAAAAGVATTAPQLPDGFGATFGDVDLDGDLDLFVAGWIHGPAGPSHGNRLFLNDGTGAFTDVSGTRIQIPSGTRGFSPTIVDMNGDRYPEILLAADFGTSRYFANRGDGTFRDLTSAAGVGLDGNGMGSAVADLDLDGRLDWIVTSIAGPPAPGIPGTGNMVYRGLGAHRFEERSVAAGLSDGFWGWGVVAADFDLDGDVDVAEVNGFSQGGYEAYPTRLWRCDGDLAYTEVGAAAGFGVVGNHRALIALDFDRDGDLDLAFTDAFGSLHLYENTVQHGPASGSFQVALDTSARPDLAPRGLGARIVVETRGRTWTQVVHGGTSYLGRSELVATFGLGAARHVDRVTVHWPDGQSTVQRNLPANTRLLVLP